MAEYTETSTARSMSPDVAQSLFSVLETKDTVSELLQYMLGIEILSSKDGNKAIVTAKRTNAPIFTEEYTRWLIQDIRSFSNNITTYTHFENDEIKIKIDSYLESLHLDMAVHGDDHFISQNSWDKILEIHDMGITIDPKSNIKNSGWIIYNIDWSYNKPVTADMLNFIKDYDEEVDQGTKFERIFNVISTMCHAALNKSLNHLTVSAIGENYKETRTEHSAEQRRRGGGSLFRAAKEVSEGGQEWQQGQ